MTLSLERFLAKKVGKSCPTDWTCATPGTLCGVGPKSLLICKNFSFSKKSTTSQEIKMYQEKIF
jgi:hypothetical protein